MKKDILYEVYRIQDLIGIQKTILKEIELFLTKPIRILDVDKNDYKETLLYTEDTTDNWKLLMREAEKQENIQKGKKFKKK